MTNQQSASQERLYIVILKIHLTMNYRSQIFNVILVVTILIILMTTIGMVGATPSQSVESDTHNSSHETIDPSLHSADGQVEVVVRLSGPDQIQIEQSNKPIDTLQTQADRAHEPVVDYAKRTRGVTIKNQFWVTNAVLLEVDTNTVDLKEIQSITGVERLHENFKVEVAATQSATPTNRTTTMSTATVGSKTTGTYTYGLEQINATGTWRQFGTKGAGVRVAVLDTGVDATNHSDLTPTAEGWKDFVSDKPEPYDDDGHGSHVSGTIVGGQAPDGMYYGVAPEAELLHGKVFDANGNAYFTDLIDGFQWSMNNDADIISLSLGTDEYTDFFIEPIETANAADITVVASAGNNGAETSSSPGNYYNTINIGATTESKQIASFSGGEEIVTADVWGDDVPESWPDRYIVPTVSAPGNAVLSTYNNGQYAEIDGTSMAAPHVSGAIALMQSATSESLTPTEIETALVDSAWKPEGAPTDRDTRYGSGIIDTYHATVSVAGSTTQADLTVDSLTVDPDTAAPNEQVVTELTVVNHGDATGTFVASLQVNGTTTQTTSVDVAPGETEQVSFVSQFDTPGNYELAINEETAGVVTVLEPAQLTISSVDLDPATVSSGESSEANVTLENTGEVSGTQELTLTATGDGTTELSTETVSLDAGDVDSVLFEVPTATLTAGTYSITAATDDDSGSGQLTVLESPSITAERTIENATVAPGEQTTVMVEIQADRPIDDLRLTETISPPATTLSATEDSTAVVIEESDTNDQVFASWNGADSATLQYAVTVPDTDSETVAMFGTVTDTDDTTVTVQGDSELAVERNVATYAGTNGRIGPQGLGDAAGDFRNGDIDPQLLGDVAAAFRTYEVVV